MKTPIDRDDFMMPPVQQTDMYEWEGRYEYPKITVKKEKVTIKKHDDRRRVQKIPRY